MSTAVNRPVWIPWEIVQWWAGWHGSERGEASAHRAVLTQRLSDWTHAEVSSRSTADHRAAVTLRSRSRTIRARDCESLKASQMSRSVLAATTITSRTNRARDWESLKASQMSRSVLAATRGSTSSILASEVTTPTPQNSVFYQTVSTWCPKTVGWAQNKTRSLHRPVKCQALNISRDKNIFTFLIYVFYSCTVFY